MARTLKTTGVATKLIAAIGVDDDGVTIKDFKGNAITVAPGVTVGASSWKGTPFPYFRTSSNGLNFNGIVWNSPVPVLPYGQGSKKWTFIGLCSAFVSGSYFLGLGNAGSECDSMALSASVPRFRHACINHTVGTTPFPTSEKFATCTLFRSGTLGAGNDCELFFANEAASSFGTADGSAFDNVKTSGNRNLISFGGIDGQGSTNADWLLGLFFDDALTQTERDEVLTQGPNAIFEAGSGGASSIPVLMNSYRQRRR